MRLRDYWKVVRGRWLMIVTITLLGGAVAAALSFPAVPQYQATASVYFSLPNGNTNADLSQGSTYTQAQMQSYAELVTQPIVLSRVMAKLGPTDITTTKELSAALVATAKSDSVILSISAQDPDPRVAAKLANTAADQLQGVVSELSPVNAKGRPSVDATTVGQAEVPTYPVSPRTKRNLAVGLLAGLMLGVAAAIARELLDTRIRDDEELAAISRSPVLARLGHERQRKGSVIMTDDPYSRSAEAFRRLRTSLRYVRAAHHVDVVTVSSTLPGEGKTTTSINFALACAEAGDRVLLIDADLRSPSVADKLGLVTGSGLTSVLTGGAAMGEVTQRWGLEHQIDVLTSGEIPPNAAELADSNVLGDLISAASKTYDLVVIDSPPLLPVTDAALLAARSSGAILVADLKKLHREELEDAVAALAQVRARLLGVVVRRSASLAPSTHYGYTAPKRRPWGRFRRGRGRGPSSSVRERAGRGQSGGGPVRQPPTMVSGPNTQVSSRGGEGPIDGASKDARSSTPRPGR